MKNNYPSPRWSGEILDCSMPMTFDTYKKCSYNCLYCFSYFQKSHTHKRKDYQQAEIESVNVEKIENLFNLDAATPSGLKQFFPYIKDRKVMQWGGLADPFDEHEKKYGVSLELLRLFKQLNYPLCFSTKGVWWLDDKRYTDLFTGQDNWNCKFSIIALDENRCAKMERGCPSPQERLNAISKYVKLNNGGATLRLRPFIIGLSDKDNEYITLIEQAAQAGATAISTEFFCLEARADDRLKKRYAAMSDILGFDIWLYYKRNSAGAGYRRLNYNLKKPYMEKMQVLCKKLGLRFYVSDAHHKEKCHNGSCCGLPPGWNYSKGQFTEALLIAKCDGTVKFSDISRHLELFKQFKWGSSCGFNTSSVKFLALYRKATMYDYIRCVWNSPKSGKSPYKYFGGILEPVGLDENGDVIYKYNKAKAK